MTVNIHVFLVFCSDFDFLVDFLCSEVCRKDGAVLSVFASTLSTNLGRTSTFAILLRSQTKTELNANSSYYMTAWIKSSHAVQAIDALTTHLLHLHLQYFHFCPTLLLLLFQLLPISLSLSLFSVPSCCNLK